MTSVVAVPAEQPYRRGKGMGREMRSAAQGQDDIGMRWRGSEAGRDSKTVRKRKVEKGRKEW